jgi:hypothetical protein
MFGHNDDNKNDSDQQTHNNGVAPADDPLMPPEVITVEPPQKDSSSDSGSNNSNDNPTIPLDSKSPISDSVTITPGSPKVDDSKSASTSSQHDDSPADLLELKQKALQELSPLVDHLDQTPEEKFRTTMMMIQASDDKSLLPQAYEAAQGIADDKVKAQSLLDVVNEINYFTQN